MILVVACGSGPHKERQGIRRRALRPSTSPRPAAINPSRAGPGLSLPPSPTPRPAGPAAMLRAMLPPAGPEAQGAAAGPGASRAEPSRCGEAARGHRGWRSCPQGARGAGCLHAWRGGEGSVTLANAGLTTVFCSAKFSLLILRLCCLFSPRAINKRHTTIARREV